jgi:hypothetical protein
MIKRRNTISLHQATSGGETFHVQLRFTISFSCQSLNQVQAQHRKVLAVLRRGLSAHGLAALLLLALAARTGSDFFHTEGPEHAGATISAPCPACQLEATTALGCPPPPVLPPLTISTIETVVPSETRPYAPPILHTQGRAPPAR